MRRTKYHHRNPYKREARKAEEEGNVKMAAEIAGMWLQANEQW
jgi:hypothetical protein